MPEDELSKVNDSVKAVTGLVKAVPIYQDALQPLAKETGKALQTIGKVVNTALIPVKGLVWGAEKFEKFIKFKVEEKLKNTHVNDICSPNLSIAGPAFESLKYVGHEETLQEMYANLLANAMDINTKDDAHPSFVEIIKQLSSEEAKLLLFLSQQTSYPDLCSNSQQVTVQGGFFGIGDSGIISNQVKKEFSDLCLDFKEYMNIDSALDNYLRLQILDIESQTVQRIEDNWFGFSMDEDKVSEKLQLEIKHNEKLFFTSFGQKFIKICVKDKI